MTTFEAAWTVSSKTMTLATLDITDIRTINVLVDDEPGRYKVTKQSVQVRANPGSFYNIMMVASALGGIVKNSHWRRAYDMVIHAVMV
ncbi:hypothetical protein TNCV_153351 [Trichonephila clavipes]|nr:hypothetical protein TNCV_153351 [Trichonephila clavipes]